MGNLSEFMSDVQYIEWLRRYILVHSYIYYELDRNIVSDKTYDDMSKKLVNLQKTIDTEGSMYYNVFKDFDGITGFDLYCRLNNDQRTRIEQVAHAVVRICG